MHDLLVKNGAINSTTSNDADLIVINTCSVTNKADKKSLYFIRQSLKQPKHPVVIVTGCFSQWAFAEIKKYGVQIIIGNQYKNDLIAIINAYQKTPICKVSNIREQKKFSYENEQTSHGDLTRAYIKIQDGCNYMCSYCLIPYVRGPQRSLAAKIIIAQINKLVANGYQEIILTGVNTAGYNDGKYDFYQLLKLINELPGEFRIRISSVEPFQITKKHIDLIVNNPRFCQFFHLCLQSGCDQTLKSMNRKYTIKTFSETVKYIRKLNPLFSITTDIIVGYPTESDANFQTSLTNIKKIKFAKMHIFPFSVRDHTVAAKLPNIVTPNALITRGKIMETLDRENQKLYGEKFINKSVDVIFEKSNLAGWQIGHSEYYFRVKVKTNKILTGKKYRVKITEIKNNELVGIIIK